MIPDQFTSLPSDLDRELVEDNFRCSTMILEDLEPEIVRRVISVLLESKALVKIRLSMTMACRALQDRAPEMDNYPREHIVSDSLG